MKHLENNISNTATNQEASRTTAWISEFDPEFSFYSKPIKNIYPKNDLKLVDVYLLIKSPIYREVTEELRGLMDTKERKEFKKKNFDYCTYSGTFSSRKDECLLKHSSLLTLDFDHVEDVVELKKRLIEDEYLETELIYVSPSGDGIKCIVKIDLSIGTHLEHFEAVSNYISATYSIKIDEGKDVSRACFLCYDPNVFINPKYLGKGNPNPAKPFELYKWRNKPAPKSEQKAKGVPVTNDTMSHVEELIQQIKARGIDLTTTYSDWIKIGFAFSDQFGEQGREYFHRVSQMHSNYSREECDRQYSNCLKSNGSGVGIGTFFQMCKAEGITYAIKREVKETTKINQVPVFPESLYPQLPHFLKRVISVGKTPAERDTLLIGAIGVLSACLSKIFGIYDGKKVYPNLYVFITGSASAGKGKLNYSKHLVNAIHEALRRETKLRRDSFNEEMAAYKKAKDDTRQKPSYPLERMLLIPANSSASGTYLLLADNNGIGLIFETEGDTLTLAFKTDYGNYSDGFRKAFHHEAISYYRKTDREYVDIKTPRLSAVLSGTPKQINALIPSAENGLFSRFLFYKIEMNPKWKDVFDKSVGGGLDNYFETLGLEFHEFYNKLNEGSEIGFKMTPNQEVEFNKFFEEINAEYLELLGEEYIATVRRIGLSAFRICMTISALRLMDTRDFSGELICKDQDLQTAFDMVKVLIKHAEQVFSELPLERQNTPRKNMIEKFLEDLPPEFNRKVYLEIASRKTIPPKTADRYIKVLLERGDIDKEGHDMYMKK
uniref:DUF3987 domain-containing protein n=1 Tax=Algoriphagus sp. TaxID=1872435 RepID=UPI00404791B4